MLAQILEPFDTPTARPAGEDRPEEHPVSLGDSGRQDSVRTDLLERSNRLVAELPRRGRFGITVEERAGVGATDPASLDSEDGAVGSSEGSGTPRAPRRRSRPS